MMRNYKIYQKAKTVFVLILAFSLAACGGGGGGGGTGSGGGKPANNANPFMAELTNNVGLRNFAPGNSGVNPPESWTNTATDNSNGSYTLTSVSKSLISGVWVQQTPLSGSQDYYLSASGNWELFSSITSIVMSTNAGGTLTWDDPYYGSTTATAVAVDISGASINNGTDYSLVLPSGTTTVKVGKTIPMDVNGNYTTSQGVIPINAIYPPGSTEWLLNGIRAKKDVYQVFGSNNFVTTPSGALTALTTPSQFTSFTTGNPLCIPGFRLSYHSNINTNTSRFNVYAASGPNCTPIVSGSILATIDLTYTNVLGKPVIQTSNCTLSLPHPFLQVYPSGNITAFFATINGATFMGNKLPTNFILDDFSASSSAKYGMKNKIAMDAVMDAAGLPTF